MDAHKIAAGHTEFTTAAAARRIETNRVAWFQVFDLRADVNHNPCAIGAEDMRKCNACPRASVSVPEVNMVERRGFEFYDRVRG
jgi:hypothetical protein